MPPLPLGLNLGIWRTHVLLDRKLDFGRGTYFLRSSLTFQAMTRKLSWYPFATTTELLQSLTDPSTAKGRRRWNGDLRPHPADAAVPEHGPICS